MATDPILLLLERAGPHRDVAAACVLLLELAHADGRVEPSELAAIRTAATRLGGLEPNEARAVGWLAATARDRHPDHTLAFAHHLREAWGEDARRGLLDALARVARADDRLDLREARVIRWVAEGLGLPPGAVRRAWAGTHEDDAAG